MYQSFLTFIRDNDLLKKSDRILAAVSGGADSMVMLHLLKLAGYDIAVAHINYGLRGDDSDGDATLVKNWCQENGVTIHIKKVKKEAYEQKGSIQMVAREIRYQFFDELLSQYGYDKIATAHNLNDQFETVLLNLTKGTGIHGLTGISTQRDQIVRPLLFATKAEVYAYAKAESIPWREDYSNSKSDYQRNLIRNEVMPLLRRINPSLEHTFLDTKSRLTGVSEMFDMKLNDIQMRVEQQGETLILDLDWYDGGKSCEVILSEWIKGFGINYRESQDLIGAIANKETGKLFYSSNHEINLNRNTILINPRSKDYQVCETIGESMGSHIVDQYEVKLQLVKGNDFSHANDPNVTYLDRDLLDFPLTVRNWQQGDYFRPLGMKGMKKVSDFLIDRKIPLSRKKDVLVLETGGKIAWLIGQRVDDRYKVTKSTKMMLKVELITPKD